MYSVIEQRQKLAVISDKVVKYCYLVGRNYITSTIHAGQ